MENSRFWVPPSGRSADLRPGRGFASRTSPSTAFRSSPECDSGEDLMAGPGELPLLRSPMGPVRGF
eukprot:6202077-Alexandrium_andersonii.AAC.1